MNLKNRSSVFIVCVILTLLISGITGLVGCSSDNSSSGVVPNNPTNPTDGGTNDDTTAATYMEVGIEKLVADYADSTDKAGTLYGDNKIQIVGKILSSEDLKVVITFEGEDNPVVVAYAVGLAAINGGEGDIVTVQGVCKGMGTGGDSGLVKLTDCIFST